MHFETAVVTKVVVMVLGSRIGNPDEGVDANRVFAVFVLRDTADIERPVIGTEFIAHFHLPYAIERASHQLREVSVGNVVVRLLFVVTRAFGIRTHATA